MDYEFYIKSESKTGNNLRIYRITEKNTKGGRRRRHMKRITVEILKKESE